MGLMCLVTVAKLVDGFSKQSVIPQTVYILHNTQTDFLVQPGKRAMRDDDDDDEGSFHARLCLFPPNKVV